jgi:hypothetical protein
LTATATVAALGRKVPRVVVNVTAFFVDRIVVSTVAGEHEHRRPSADAEPGSAVRERTPLDDSLGGSVISGSC